MSRKLVVLKDAEGNVLEPVYGLVRLEQEYTQNAAVNETNFFRIVAWRYGALVVVTFNCIVNLAALSGWVNIGKLILPAGYYCTGVLATIPQQEHDGGTLLIQIEQNGNVRIYNGSPTPIDSFCRGSFIMGIYI